MPNYKALTITAECAILDQKIQQIKDVDSKLNTKDIAEGPKQSLTQQKNLLAGQIGQAIDKVLAACDVAEQNNRDYCQYMVDGHRAAKVEMDKIDPLLKRLEIAWDDRAAFVLTHAVGQVEEWETKLKKDDEALRAVKMVDEYRGNGWKTSVNGGLPYAKDRAAAFATREKNRQTGIEMSTAAVQQRARVFEYVTRAKALQKTASALLDHAMGAEKNYVKIRDEMIDFVNKLEKTVNEYSGQFLSTKAQMDRLIKTALAVKAPTKDTYKPVLLFEPKIEPFLKELRGKAKTMKIEFGEESKKVQVKGMPDRYFKPQLARADTLIKQFDKGYADFEKALIPMRKLIEVGKKAH
jgi:hypothetical protein